MRAISSAGSEHLPYKQGVTGSNPVSPTKPQLRLFFWAISSVGLERLLDRQEVTGSNPVLPTYLLNAPYRGFFILQQKHQTHTKLTLLVDFSCFFDFGRSVHFGQRGHFGHFS